MLRFDDRRWEGLEAGYRSAVDRLTTETVETGVSGVGNGTT